MLENGFSLNRILAILSLYGKISASENPYSHIFHAVVVSMFGPSQLSDILFLNNEADKDTVPKNEVFH